MIRPSGMRTEGNIDSSWVAAALSNEGELRLLRKVAMGDRQAFQTLYVSYHRRLARFLTRMTRRYDVAEEIINDTLWVVWCKAAEFRGDSQVSTWIMGIAYRRALKTLKRVQAANREASLEMVDEQPGAANALEVSEQHEWIERALGQLPVEQRMAIELTYFLGHSCEEIATIMECPVNTVKTRMFHARRKLRVLLQRVDGVRDGGST
jgi:RNA polymerase sigma-70 factor, ECF subfamily